MAFSYYSSNDSGSPVLNGDSGSLINVLDACLVNGYGTKASAGWSKPFVNTTNPHCGCWQQPSGSRLMLFVNDSAPLGGIAAGTQEAWATGYEIITNLNTPVGTGSGMFPLFSQNTSNMTAPYGHVCWRKTNDTSSMWRRWQMWADDRTFYLFNLCSFVGTEAVYGCMWFGDIYSFSTSPDNYKCIITGRTYENRPDNAGNWGDYICNPAYSTVGVDTWIARGNVGGISTALQKVGDMGKVSVGGAYVAAAGILPTPSPADRAFYMSPLFLTEPATGNIRGKFRGLWHICHPLSNIVDGQTIQGSNEYCNRSFVCVKQGGQGGMWAVEIGNTVDTNYT